MLIRTAIGLLLSRTGGKIVGVETVEAAVQDVRRNADLNGIANADFYGRERSAEPMGLQKVDAAVVDPPRKGCDAVLNALAEADVPALVYVSCNPAIGQGSEPSGRPGYGVFAAGDMFPGPATLSVTMISRVK